MPVDTRAFSPIIEAMIATANHNREMAAQKLNEQKAATEEKENKERLKQAQQQIDQAHEAQLKQHEIALSHLDIQKRLADMQAEQSRIDRIEKLQTIGKKGGSPGNIIQSLPGLFADFQQTQQPQTQIDFSKMGGRPEIHPEALGANHPDYVPPQPQQAAPPPLQGSDIYDQAREVANIKAEEAAKAEGKLPSELTLQKDKQNFEERMKNAEIASQEKITGMHTGSAEKIAGWNNATQRDIAKMHTDAQLKMHAMQYEVTPEVAQNMVVMAGTGQIKLNPDNMIDRKLLSAMANMGWRNPDPKEIMAAKKAQELIPLFKDLKTFINTHLAKTQMGAFVQGHKLDAQKSIKWPAEVLNELNRIRSKAITIGKDLESMTGGRVTVVQMETDLNSIGDGHIPQDQGMRLLGNLTNTYINQQNNVLFAGMPDTQKDAIRAKQGIVPFSQVFGEDPEWLRLAPKVNSKGHKLDEEMSIKMGKPVYAAN
jgi:hypothetical protein